MKRLIILLLIVGCGTEPEDSCNYDVDIEACNRLETNAGYNSCPFIIKNVGDLKIDSVKMVLTMSVFQSTLVDTHIIVNNLHIPTEAILFDTLFFTSEIVIVTEDLLPDSTHTSGMSYGMLNTADSIKIFLDNKTAYYN